MYVVPSYGLSRYTFVHADFFSFLLSGIDISSGGADGMIPQRKQPRDYELMRGLYNTSSRVLKCTLIYYVSMIFFPESGDGGIL